jgi:hypothetical protein
MSPCSSCGRPIDPATATLSTGTGLPVCAMCTAREALVAQQGRAVRNLAFGALGGALGAPILTFCLCGPFGVVVSVLAMISGVRAATLLNQPDYRTRTDRQMLSAVSITGVVLACGTVTLYALATFAGVGSSLLRGR